MSGPLKRWLFRGLKSVTVIAIAGFLWKEYKDCEQVTPLIQASKTAVRKYSTEGRAEQAATLRAERNVAGNAADEASEQYARLSSQITVMEAIQVVNDVLDKLWKAHKTATGSDACSMFNVPTTPLASVDREKWLAALASSNLPLEQAERTQLVNGRLIEAMERVRRLKPSTCSTFDHSAIGQTTRFILYEYRQDDQWFRDVRRELRDVQAKLAAPGN